MDLLRQFSFFNPIDIKDEIHVIGVGAIGSHIVEMLVRMGIEDIHIYDFDEVNSHNIPNQMFFENDIGTSKCESLLKTCTQINQDCKETITVHEKGYTEGMPLNGYVFLCVDSIGLRKTIATAHMYNPHIIAMFDFRMGLESAQHYATKWNNPTSKTAFLATMNFTDEEAKEAMPVSACGSALCVLPTIRAITSLGIANWMNFIKEGKLRKTILVDAFNFTLDAFE